MSLGTALTVCTGHPFISWRSQSFTYISKSWWRYALCSHFEEVTTSFLCPRCPDLSQAWSTRVFVAPYHRYAILWLLLETSLGLCCAGGQRSPENCLPNKGGHKAVRGPVPAASNNMPKLSCGPFTL